MLQSLPSPFHLTIAAVLAIVIAGLAYFARSLSISGAITAFVVGFTLFGFGGWPGAASLLLFFITSTALSKFGKREKEQLATYEKGDRRDAGQVFANGGVSVLCMIWIVLQPHNGRAIAALLGSLASANADTWATEIGTLIGPRMRIKPILLATLRPGEPGQSGAISLPGTLAALMGAFVIAITAPLWHPESLTGTVLAVTTGGLAGSLVDSWLGGVMQVQYRDCISSRLTERSSATDGRENPVAQGVSWMNNDVVNFLATAAGAVIAAWIA